MLVEILKPLDNLKYDPIGVAFLDGIPTRLKRIDRSTPAGCSYWTLAACGQCFYTTPEDHYGCPIGAHTHGLESPPEVADLQSTVQTMLSLKYLHPEEPSALPRVTRPYTVIVYGPLDAMPVPADIVIVIGSAKTLMLLNEAARQIGLPSDTLMGRPGCGMIPQVLNTQRAVTNLGCIGNRVYTGIADDEFYFAFPGQKLSEIVDSLRVIAHANQELGRYHEERRRMAGAVS